VHSRCRDFKEQQRSAVRDGGGSTMGKVSGGMEPRELVLGFGEVLIVGCWEVLMGRKRQGGEKKKRVVVEECW